VVFDTDEHVKAGTTMESAGQDEAGLQEGRRLGHRRQRLGHQRRRRAFFVLAAADVAARAGHKPLARLVSYAVAGVPNDVMGEGPIPASRIALKKAGLTVSQMDVIESNEAFAAQAITVSRGLELDPAKTNPNGGAIALGHPIGCSGAFIATKAAAHLRTAGHCRTGGRYALVTMCIGGGQGIAAVFERAHDPRRRHGPAAGLHRPPDHRARKATGRAARPRPSSASTSPTTRATSTGC
jgi:acetyl-CoA C-acetyltransferase